LDVRGGLTRRTIVASAVVAALVGAAFALLLRAVLEERESLRSALRSQQVLTVANSLERLVLDIETGQRGFFLERRTQFLEPWTRARASYPSVAAELQRLTTTQVQAERAQRIRQLIDHYVTDYSVPLVRAAERGDTGATRDGTLADGKRRVDAIRAEFDRLIGAERSLSTTAESNSTTDSNRAVAVATAGLAASIVLVALFGAYVIRAMVAPLRRAATMAGALAGGDLSTRMPETAPGEVGELERAFNTMGRSLQANTEALRTVVDEQAALRRVATLVARGAAPGSVFEAVADEVRLLLGADSTRLLRYEDDGSAAAVAGDMAPETERLAADVLRTGAATRTDTSVGVPIVVEGFPWGVMVASWQRPDALPADVESRMADFTALVGTAIANAQGRAELSASRARVVAAADDTRRRIERDLHDGAQQRLVHTVITLKLAKRAFGGGGDSGIELVDEALGHAERATAELRELAHGILPGALSRGGLRSGINNLVARMPVKVTVDVGPERFEPAVEATVYFIVAEGLTNVAKHARATTAHVAVTVVDGALDVEVRDDGVGGATVDGTTGLMGLQDRAAALNGELRVDSRPGGGTVVRARLPLQPGK
jgi:signal transduction histidine kinase